MSNVKAPVTSDINPKKKSRQTKYRESQEAKGLTQLNKWIPNDIYDDVMLMLELCIENEDLTPHTVRSKTTGRMRGIQQ